MKLLLGFSPCPNDTYMMDALVHRRIEVEDIDFEVAIEDVETLNQRVLSGKADISKVSIHTYLKAFGEFRLLRSGAALGFGCGPLLIGRKALSEKQVKKGPVALPGENTTAHLLFRLRYPDAVEKDFMLFSEIEDAVLRGDAAAGVIIHENRFTYREKGLVLIEDLGATWERETRCPIPLGGFVARRSLGDKIIGRVEEAISRSVQHAFAHPSAPDRFVREHAQEMNAEIRKQHIEMYVNSFSIDLGDEGLRAVDVLQRRARAEGLLTSYDE